MMMTNVTTLINYLSPMSVEEEDPEFLVDPVHVMQAFVLELDLDLLLPLLDRPITFQIKNLLLGLLSQLQAAVGLDRRV